MSDRKVRRRQFLQASATAAAGFVIVKPGSVYGSPANDAVTLGIIGCGGRGNYVGKEMVGAGARVIALHDLFDDRLAETRGNFDKLAEEKGAPKIADGMLFKGPDAYHKLLASGVDAVLITSPPYFHPDHFEAAVDAKKHCYLEKPVASDVFGARRVESAGRKGAGKVSMAVGFQSHYAEPYQEMVRRIHAGAIGDIVCAQTYYYTDDLKRKATPGMPPLEARVRNWVFDRALSGDILVEQNIHVLDIVNWVMRSRPVSAMATGGKKARLDVDCWDHYNVELNYPGNVHVSFNSTQFKNSYDAKTQRFLGTKGYAEASFGKGGVRIVGEEPWESGAEEGLAGSVPRKVAAFVESIRTKNLQDEVAGGVDSTLTAILGRTAAYESEGRSWEKVAGSKERWPKIDLASLASPSRA
ncbi:MAG: gfo/Idh/MocA family oxidoreductase [Acidobacteria bacterium]|nr:MAG: gfo/Idh/MocA family oxidoreductase [Acidobacteriota bacterium]